MRPTRGRAAKPTKSAVHDSTQDNAGSGQQTTLSTKTDAAQAYKAGRVRGTGVVVKGAAGRKTGGRRTATSNSAEVRAAMRSTRSGGPPPLHPEEEDASSDCRRSTRKRSFCQPPAKDEVGSNTVLHLEVELSRTKFIERTSIGTGHWISVNSRIA